MELDKIRELVRLVEESQIQELELSNRGETIRIAKAGAAAPASALTAPPAAAVPAAATAASPAPAPAPAAVPVGREVNSPIVGTFYRSPSPESEPFVKVGDRVAVGDVLCIIEAMKVMNEIKAETTGVVRKILVENATSVEFGQPLFLVEPR
jgi:acetyl-CoA carboxylase biotin carboxyl carrier protein